MLKATFNGKYRSKKGNVMYTYKVTGPAAEVAQYAIVQEASANAAPGTWAKVDNHPLFFLNVTAELRNNSVPQLQYDLIFSQDGTRVYRDDTKAEQIKYAKLEAIKTENMGRIMAELELGITTRAAALPVIAQPQPAAATGGEPKSLADQMAEEMQEAPAGETAIPKVGAEVGGETLAE